MQARFFASIVALSVALSMTALAPCSARAQDDPSTLDAEARSLFEAGRTAFAAGRFESALGYFRQAYDLSQRATLLYNIGTAADRLRLDAEALEAFRGYLAALPDAENRAEVVARIRVLEASTQAARDATQVATPIDPGPPTAEETARAAVEASDSGGEDHAPSGGSITDEWWFWTIIAVVVVGAGVGIGVGVATSSPSLEAPLPGTQGAVVFALEGR